jgi:uncharacterized protein involved in tellurium resistance
MSFDTLGRKWEERRRDTLVVDAETGRVKDGGIAMIISRSERAKTTITINAFKATGSGKIDGTDGLMDLQVGFYEIDRLTGSYKARVVLNSRLVPGSSVMSTTEEDGVCKLGSRKF